MTSEVTSSLEPILPCVDDDALVEVGIYKEAMSEGPVCLGHTPVCLGNQAAMTHSSSTEWRRGAWHVMRVLQQMELF